MRLFGYANAVGLTTMAFASYFDVYSHAHIFVGVDPWWNPAHLLLYAGFAFLAYGAVADRPRGFVGRLSLAGVAVVLAAAAFNEVWHRVLLFGNPLPEPFPVEPPHALLAVGIIMVGAAALVSPLTEGQPPSGRGDRLALSFVSGSLWLVTAGSAFYVGGAYASTAAYLFAVGVASFCASLFIVYSAGASARFGYATLSYLWFLAVYYIFFVTPADGLPFGIALVVAMDFALTRRGRHRADPRLLLLPVVALLYGAIYYPVLPPGLAFALNTGLAASALGVAAEFAAEKAAIRLLASGPRT